MTTTPSGLVVPASMVTETWLKKHERIVLVTLVLFFGSLGLHHFLFNQAAAATQRATIAEAALASQKTLDVQQAQATAQVTAQYQAMVAQLTSQNNTLATAITSRQEALGKQQQVNAQLPLGSLTQRLVALAQPPAGSVSNTETSVTMTQPATLAVVNQLEQVPVLSVNLTNETTIAQNTQTELTASGTVISAQVNQISGLQKTLVDETNQCKAEVSAAKKRGRLQSFKWAVRGFFVGVVAGLYAGHAI